MQVPGDNDQCIDGERQRHVGASSGLPGRGVGDFRGNWGAFRIICLCFKDAGGSLLGLTCSFYGRETDSGLGNKEDTTPSPGPAELITWMRAVS